MESARLAGVLRYSQALRVAGSVVVQLASAGSNQLNRCGEPAATPVSGYRRAIL